MKDHIVYITADGTRRTIAVTDLDSDATVRVNQERGTTLQLSSLEAFNCRLARESNTQDRPSDANIPAYKNPAAGLTSDHSAPTTTLDTKSPMPFAVARTPKPVPRTSPGSNSAAIDFSSDC